LGREGCFGIVRNVSFILRGKADDRMSSESLAANGESLVSYDPLLPGDVS
jgi:hypothetical protein